MPATHEPHPATTQCDPCVSESKEAPSEAQHAAQLVELYMCPISRALLVDPVLCSDGSTYERRCIESWLAGGSDRSPTTNLPLKHHTLMACNTTRQAVSALVESGAVDHDTAAAWHFASGRLKVEAGAVDSEDIATRHFERAVALGCKEATIALGMMRLKRKADEAGLSEGLLVFPDRKRRRHRHTKAASEPPQQHDSEFLMQQWEPLARCSRVRVMRDVAQLRECVNRFNEDMESNSSTSLLHFNDAMERFAGRTCTVLTSDAYDQTFKLRLESGAERLNHECPDTCFWFPYKAVSVVHRVPRNQMWPAHPMHPSSWLSR